MEHPLCMFRDSARMTDMGRMDMANTVPMDMVGILTLTSIPSMDMDTQMGKDIIKYMDTQDMGIMGLLAMD